MSRRNDVHTCCPFCGYNHDAVSPAPGESEYALPNPGDVTLCFGCGNWCVWDPTVDTKLRKPTVPEKAEMDKMKGLKRLHEAWKLSVRKFH